MSANLDNMTEEENTAAPAPASPVVSILKDTKSVRTQDFLLMHDLDDIAGCRDVYLQSRTEWLEYYALLRILDPVKGRLGRLGTRGHGSGSGELV